MRMIWLFVVGCAVLLTGCPPPGGSSTTTGGCTQGSRDCGCRSDQTCDAPLTCNAGTCRETSRDTPGAVCDAALTCGSYQGTQMVCEAGRCQLPGCPTGTVGCPCPDDVCTDTGTQCSATKVCVVTGCVPGSAGCTCGAANACDDGLSCQAGACRAVGSISISVSNAAVRSCDLLIAETTRAVTGVTFPASAVGEHLRRAPRVAISFTRKADSNPAGAVATLQLAGATAATPSLLTLAETHCFDRAGEPVTAPGVRLE